MDRELEVELTPRLLRWTIFYQLRPLLSIGAIMTVAIGFLIHTNQVMGPDELSLPFTAYLFPGFFIIFILWLPFQSYSKSMAQIKKFGSSKVKYRFTDDQLHVSTGLSSSQGAWSLYKGLHKHPQLWRIITSHGLSLVLPIEALDDELKTFLTVKLPKKKGGFRPFRTLAFWLLVFVIIMYFLNTFQHR